MYIGPWQEYKLARLIQHHQEQQQKPSEQRRVPSHNRRLVVSRQRKDSGNLNDDAASVASSNRSGQFVSTPLSFKSTQSAPAQLPANSAQARLNDFYEHWERTAKQDTGTPSSQGGGRRPPRPRSSLGGRSGCGQAAAKRRPKAKAKSAKSFEEERRARILHMKRVYGLAEPEEASACNLNETSASNRVDSTASLRGVDDYRAASPTPVPDVPVEADSFTPDFDRALIELQASMAVREEPHLRASPDPLSGGDSLDPFALSLSAESMGGSGGLIAWSKNLRPEDLSPDVTLASFLRPV